MTEESRCCGSGTCIIDAEGRCWCGQQWDGEKMAAPPRLAAAAPAAQPVDGADFGEPDRRQTPA